MSQDGLFRLLKSEFCDAHLTVHYLFHSKNKDIRDFLGKKLFELPDDDIELFLPQLIHLYINYAFVAEELHSYVLYRCLSDDIFALKTLWWLKACSKDDWMNPDAKRRALRLLDIIIANDATTKNSAFQNLSPGNISLNLCY